MEAKESFFTTEWDKLGNGINGTFFYGDWNETLLTKINQVSANIFQSSLIGGANKIRLNSKVFPLIENHEYYNKERKILAGKYHVVIDNNIDEDIVIVMREITDEEIATKEYPKNRIAEIGIDEYKKSLLGYVKIKNL